MSHHRHETPTLSCRAEPDATAPWHMSGWVGKGAEEAVGRRWHCPTGVLGGTLPCWGGWRAEWCHPPRATLGLSGTGRMVPSPWERGGTCAHTVSVRGQLGGPRPPASAWLHPGSCCSLPGTAGACWNPAREAMLWVLSHSRGMVPVLPQLLSPPTPTPGAEEAEACPRRRLPKAEHFPAPWST